MKGIVKDFWQDGEAWIVELFLLSQDNLHQEVDQDAIKQSSGAET
jgi:hypothetical protein